ncbi:MAG: hypothetical protein J0M18_13745 [Ignavibacteria bacterium]|nr:hypothetical protein [Ignavibacteria bacterium]
MSGIFGGYPDSDGNYSIRHLEVDRYIKLKNYKINLNKKAGRQMVETLKPVSGIGVPDGDGGSLEREERTDELTTEETQESAVETDEDDEEINPLEDEGDWAENGLTAARGNSLGNDSDNRRDNESIEGSLNNSGVKASGGGNVSMLKYFNIEFYESEDGNRTIGCGASTESGFYFKGE